MQNLTVAAEGVKNCQKTARFGVRGGVVFIVIVCFLNLKQKAVYAKRLRDDLSQQNSNKKIIVYSFTINHHVQWTKTALTGGAWTAQRTVFEYIFEINI